MISPFLVFSAMLIHRFGIWVGLGVGFVFWMSGSIAIMHADLPFLAAIVLNLAAFPVSLFLSHPYLDVSRTRATKGGILDVALRTTVVVAVGAAVIITGRLIGPEMAGFVAIIPIVWLSMSAVLYARAVCHTTAAVLANGVAGMFGFCLALTALHLMEVQSGATAALLVAFFICVCWSLGLTIARPFIPFYRRRGPI